MWASPRRLWRWRRARCWRLCCARPRVPPAPASTGPGPARSWPRATRSSSPRLYAGATRASTCATPPTSTARSRPPWPSLSSTNPNVSVHQIFSALTKYFLVSRLRQLHDRGWRGGAGVPGCRLPLRPHLLVGEGQWHVLRAGRRGRGGREHAQNQNIKRNKRWAISLRYWRTMHAELCISNFKLHWVSYFCHCRSKIEILMGGNVSLERQED